MKKRNSVPKNQIQIELEETHYKVQKISRTKIAIMICNEGHDYQHLDIDRNLKKEINYMTRKSDQKLAFEKMICTMDRTAVLQQCRANNLYFDGFERLKMRVKKISCENILIISDLLNRSNINCLKYFECVERGYSLFYLDTNKKIQKTKRLDSLVKIPSVCSMQLCINDGFDSLNHLVSIINEFKHLKIEYAMNYVMVKYMVWQEEQIQRNIDDFMLNNDIINYLFDSIPLKYQMETLALVCKKFYLILSKKNYALPKVKKCDNCNALIYNCTLATKCFTCKALPDVKKQIFEELILKKDFTKILPETFGSNLIENSRTQIPPEIVVSIYDEFILTTVNDVMNLALVCKSFYSFIIKTYSRLTYVSTKFTKIKCSKCHHLIVTNNYSIGSQHKICGTCRGFTVKRGGPFSALSNISCFLCNAEFVNMLVYEGRVARCAFCR